MKHNTKNQPSPLPHTGVKQSCLTLPAKGWQVTVKQAHEQELARRKSLENLPDRINDNNLCDGDIFQETDSDILEAMENL